VPYPALATPLATAQTVFRPNQTHHQQDIFGIEAQLSPGLRKRLLESKEHAFYKEIFCRIPETLFAELYAGELATRPNVPVNLLVGAMILQHANDWTFGRRSSSALSARRSSFAAQREREHAWRMWSSRYRQRSAPRARAQPATTFN